MKRSKSLEESLVAVKYEQYINNMLARIPQLVEPNDIDCQRWPWELVQNAKDTVVKRSNPKDRFVDILINHYTDTDGEKKLYFEHNGDQFTNKAITGLIWKFSAEKRNEQTTEDGLTRDKQSTGRFGTGFMTTHALSLTVDVSGSLFHDDPDIMRNVSVDFTLHREGPDDKAYKDGVDLTEKELDKNMDSRPIPIGESLPTRFTYHLKKGGNEKAAKMGIDNVRANAAQTMLFCPSVRSITVIDEVNNLKFKITRKNNDERKDIVKEIEFVEECSERREPITRKFISIEIEEYSEPISSHWKAKGRNLRLNVAVEVDKNNNILPIPSTSPAVYCSLPLIGFESMSLPYYINSNDFEPPTERTSLYLNKRRFEYHTNEETGSEEILYLKSGINWSIFERSISLYEKIVDYLIDKNYKKRYNLINGLNDIFKGPWEKETKNCLASRFILPLRKMLAGKKLVKTVNEYRSIKSDVKFIECAKECNLHALYNICEAIYGTNLAEEQENEKWVLLKWGRFTFDPDFDEKKAESDNPAFPTIKYDKIAEYIENAKSLSNLQLILPDIDETSLETTEGRDAFVKTQKLKWLNNFYEWVKISKITNLSEKKIVPNRLGEFCSTEQGCELKDACDISTVIFDFMKQIKLDWDKNLLMEGVQHVTLAKETKDNVTTAIKNRSKEIRDDLYDKDENKLVKLVPILLALPANEDARNEVFLKKREQIVAILNVMYANKCKGGNTVSLDLKAETWEDTDKWFMNLVASTLADRKHLDVINDDDSEEDIKTKYCTSEWLSDTLNFMFQESYLHQEDISSKEDKNDTLALFPNRYGNFCPINELHMQGHVPEELLDDELNKTGYDIKAELLFKGFTLNNKVSITELTITSLAKKYNEFFNGDGNGDDKLAVAQFLINLIPECGDQYKETRTIFNMFEKANNEDIATTTIATSDLTIWKGANEYLIKYLCTMASEFENVYKIGEKISVPIVEPTEKDKERYLTNGLNWLNRLASIQRTYKVELNEELRIIPDWYGILHPTKEVTYNGAILNQYEYCNSLVNLVDSDLWSHFPNENKLDGDEGMTNSIVHPQYVFAEEFQRNTDEKLFNLVDRLVSFCSEHNSTEWRTLLKRSIQTLLKFFEANESSSKPLFCIRNVDDTKLSRLFPETYKNRKNLSYDYIYDAETKARFSQMNDNYSSEEIEKLIDNKDFVKKILQSKDPITIQKIIEEFPDTDFKSILNILRREQGEFNIERFQQNISDERKREIGDKGECFVYEMLCSRFGSSNVTWSNFAPNDENARIVNFYGREYRLSTTPHDFDFVVSHNDKSIYIEVKTTVGSIRSSKDFPLIFEPKEWEWIDVNNEDNALHYIVRVFDVEKNPKAYYLKQALNVD